MADKNPNLEMLMQREQLMEDIDGICDEFFYEKYNGDIAERDELTRILCAVSYTHLRAHETTLHLVCRLLLEKKK